MPQIDLAKALTFKDRQSWRKWLQQHHATEKEALIIHNRKSSGKGGLTHLEAMEEALCWGWIDSILRKLDGERFVLRYTPRKPGSIWSMVNRNHAERLIKEGKITPAGLAKIEEAKRNGNWDNAYTNLRSGDLPTDLKTALQSDVTAWDNFQRFSNTYRNLYIGWVNDAKTPETRGKRIREVVHRARINMKPGIDTRYYHLESNDKG